jgi:hypothetical protein
MPTYYNGKEITATSIMSGVDLDGKSSIKIGGRDVALSTPPRRMRVYGNSGGSGGSAGYSDSESACAFGPVGSGDVIDAYISVGKDTYLFMDEDLNTPLVDGYYWSDDTTEIGGGRGSFFILIQGSSGAIFGRPTACSGGPIEYRFSGSSGSSGTTGYGSNENACALGPMSGQGEFVLYGAEGEEFSTGLQLYDDVELTISSRVRPGIYYNLDTNQSVQLNRGIVDTVIPCG